MAWRFTGVDGAKSGKNYRKPSRKGTVADRLIIRLKTEKHQQSLQKVRIRPIDLENVYTLAGEYEYEYEYEIYFLSL